LIPVSIKLSTLVEEARGGGPGGRAAAGAVHPCWGFWSLGGVNQPEWHRRERGSSQVAWGIEPARPEEDPMKPYPRPVPGTDDYAVFCERLA